MGASAVYAALRISDVCHTCGMIWENLIEKGTGFS